MQENNKIHLSRCVHKWATYRVMRTIPTTPAAVPLVTSTFLPVTFSVYIRNTVMQRLVTTLIHPQAELMCMCCAYIVFNS